MIGWNAIMYMKPVCTRDTQHYLYSGQQPAYSGYPLGQPPYQGQQPLYQGPQTSYPGQQQPYPGQQPPYPAQHSYTAQQILYPGQQSHNPQYVGEGILMSGPAQYEAPMEQELDNFDFDDQSVRRGFIRKVYSILMVQLLLSFAVVTLFTFHEPTKQFVLRTPQLWWIALILVFVTILAMACCDSVRRKVPFNFIFLFVFTAAQSFMLGTLASAFDGDAVMMAVGLTAAVSLGLTLFAFQTKWDFTVLSGGLLAASIVLLIFGIVVAIFPGKVLILLYASIGVIIFSLYLVMDTQLMMGGKHRYSLSPEEYIFAALNLYLDIVNIFVYILTIIGVARS
ncbi:protein lifeguard 1-like isoform X2 [Bacillus rossius redtenbacheri]|uniref:protein lifeguard 1-like isoform X2 n=1 Tax=Bacillus rossius redtenbacheri TaxID=93214 RepID=UPI002FDCC581